MSQPNLPSSGDGTAGSAGYQTRQERPAAAAGVPERPALAPAVQLTGEMQESGYKDRQWLIQRDGRFVQLTELLYRVAEQANGERTLEEIAAGVTESTDWMVTADNVRQLIQMKLIPLGLITPADGTIVSRGEERARSPLALNVRMRMIGPRLIDPVTKVLQVLFAPPILVPVLIAVAIAHGWLYFVHGVVDSFRDALYTPGGLLIVLVIILAAAVFHEFGHAAALRYGGGKVRGMGAGIYLIYPVLYTDVTDSYRLGRWARVRTGLGGIYFHLIFALGVMALYFVSEREFVLLAVALINLEIIRQFIPFVRLDGYWVLADLTGIPDFFSQMGPFLRSVLPIPGWKGDKLPNLKPWVKAVFAMYIIVTIPVLSFLLYFLVTRLPLILSNIGDSLLVQRVEFSDAQSIGDFVSMAAVGSQILLLLLPLLGIAYLLLYSLGWRLIRATWRQPTPVRRVVGTLITASVIAGLAFLWVPDLPFLGKAEPAGVESFEVSEREHVQTAVSYPQIPPVGGDHAPIWQNCGFYNTPVADENAVHALEHGAVWIAYRPDLTEEQIESVRRLAQRQNYVLASLYPDLSAPLVASAWGHQLRLDSADDPRLGQFVRAFRLGSQAPERGGPCTGGTGAAS